MKRFVASVMILLGIGFLFAGGSKLTDPAGVEGLFRSWGVSDPVWIPVAGWVEALLGLLLLNPPTRRTGSVVLALWMVPWGLLQGASGAFGAMAASAVVLALAVGFAVTDTRPFAPAAGWILPPLLVRPRGVRKTLHTLAGLVGVSFLIRWTFGGTAFWTALPVLGWIHARHPDASDPGARSVVEGVTLYLLVLGLGVSGLWAFVGHTFMAGAVSDSVGWAPSPFQRELAFYHLGLGLAGLACWWVRDHFWVAVGGIASVFLYGAGWVHLHDFIATGNRAPANWGPGVLFGSVLIPTTLLTLVVVRALRGRPVAPSASPGP